MKVCNQQGLHPYHRNHHQAHEDLHGSHLGHQIFFLHQILKDH